MLEYEFLKVANEWMKTFKEFPLPVVIVNERFHVYWSNGLAKDFYPQITTTNGLARLLLEFDQRKIWQEVREQGACSIGDILPFSGSYISFSPIWSAGELVGLVLVLLGGKTELPDICHTTSAAQALSEGIRQAVGEVFGIMDTTAYKADILEMGWIKPNFERIGYYGYRVLRIADNITEYTRLQSGILDLQLQTVDVFSLLRDLSRPVADLARPMGIPVVFRVPRGQACVQLDQLRFTLILFNLLHNALYFTRPDNEVTVEARKTGAKVEIRVIDRGMGIPAAVLPRVFAPYSFHDPSGKQPTVGLGLTLAKLLTEVHGGMISIDSRLGEGTRVTLLLPENGFSGELPLAQSLESDELMGRFSHIYTGLADVFMSPYRGGAENRPQA